MKGAVKMEHPDITKTLRTGYPKPYMPDATDEVIEAVEKTLARFILTQDISQFVVADWVYDMIKKYKESV